LKASSDPFLSENMVATKMAPEFLPLLFWDRKKTNVADVLP
jgi:hypothetical protein